MKCYAVTNDSNELAHYGIKGMRWGVIRTDAQLGHPTKPSKPRSPAYQKAASKLGTNAMHRGISDTQKNWNALLNNSSANKQLRDEQRAINKALRDYKRSERLFEKHVQLARQGRLKYKGISDSEVQRITDRLALENRARMQSGNEKPSFIRRLRESAGNGIVQGFGQGMSVRTSEWVGRGAKLKTQRMLTEQQNELHEAQAKRDFKRSMREQKKRDKYQRRRADEDERIELRKAYENTAIEEGLKVKKHLGRHADDKRRKMLYDMRARREEENSITNDTRRLAYEEENDKRRLAYEKENDKRKLAYEEEKLKLQQLYGKKNKKDKKDKNNDDGSDTNNNADHHPSDPMVFPDYPMYPSRSASRSSSDPVVPPPERTAPRPISDDTSLRPVRPQEQYASDSEYRKKQAEADAAAAEYRKRQAEKEEIARRIQFDEATKRAQERQRAQEEAVREAQRKKQEQDEAAAAWRQRQKEREDAEKLRKQEEERKRRLVTSRNKRKRNSYGSGR